MKTTFVEISKKYGLFVVQILKKLYDFAKELAASRKEPKYPSPPPPPEKPHDYVEEVKETEEKVDEEVNRMGRGELADAINRDYSEN